MNSSYNHQEEINDLTARLNEVNALLTVRIEKLENSVKDIERALRDMMMKIDNAERKQRRSDIKVEDLQGTLAQKLRTLGQITKWDKPK